VTIDIETLRSALSAAGPFGTDEVCALLFERCPDLVEGSDIRVDRLNSRVFRASGVRDHQKTSVVVKHLTASVGERNELVIGRWLPGIGLPKAAPALLGAIGDRTGTHVWHVYEDLGTTVLDARSPHPHAVAAAVELIAQLHTLAAAAPLLTECRQHLTDLGMHYFVSNVGDAIAGLESLGSLEDTFTSAQRVVRDRLLERLCGLRESIPLRADFMREFGGPQTLLHGDLWNINTVVIASSEGMEARLIDWDRAGVGPVAYDVSTFLYRFAPVERPWILQRYRDAVSRAGWRLPEAPDLNLLFETAECARYANRIIWPAAALLSEGDASGHDELAQILGWFEALEPVLSTREARTA
jgi:hypothetical protein